MSSKHLYPFLLRYGTPLPDPDPIEIRYDAGRQISVVPDGGSWRPTLDAAKDDPPQTMVTHVRRETTTTID